MPCRLVSWSCPACVCAWGDYAAPYQQLDTPTDGLESHLSRGQRKRLEKKQHVLRKLGKAELGLKAAAAEQQQQGQQQAVLRLDAISDALDTLPEHAERPATVRETVVKSNKMKHKTAVKEAEHLKLVLQHPAYQSNPLAAIKTHLENTIGKQHPQQR